MPATDTDLYKAHVLNIRAVEGGLAHIARDLNRAISVEDGNLAETLKKLHLFLAGAWAECRLKKLVYEPGALSSELRSEITAQRTQSERWKKALELGYRKRYGVRKAAISEHSVGGTASFRYTALHSLISDELNPLIELRNTLAHGQWSRPLNSSETDISGILVAKINAENALSVKLKLSMVANMASLIHDLIAATSFERDFDLHYNNIVTTRTNLQKRSYNNWKQGMVRKYGRGLQKRDEAIRAAVNPNL